VSHHHPSQADLENTLAYEIVCAQIEALRTLRAISVDLSNPKEARLAAAAILKYSPKVPAAPPVAPTLPARVDADATLDADLAGG
jgi:hypothetical protein